MSFGPFLVHVWGSNEDATNKDRDLFDKSMIERHNKSQDKFNKGHHKQGCITI